MFHRFTTSIACLALLTLLAEATSAQGPGGGQAGGGGGMCANRGVGTSQTDGVMSNLASAQSSGIAASSNQVISQAYGIRGLGRRGSSSSSQFRQMQNYQQNYFRQMQAQQLQAQQQEAQANAAMHDRLLKAADARRAAETKLRKINSAPSTSSSESTPASTARANARATLGASLNANTAKPSLTAKPMSAGKRP